MRYLVLFLLLISSVHGLGVATTYLEDNTLELSPGASIIYDVNIQNSEDREVHVELVMESEIAKLLSNSTVIIPPKYYDTVLKMNVSVPKDASLGQMYEVKYHIQPVDDQGSTMSLNLRIAKSFKVKVIPSPSEQIVEEQSPRDFEEILVNFKEIQTYLKERYPNYGEILPFLFVPVALAVLVLLFKRSHLLVSRFKHKEHLPVVAPTHSLTDVALPHWDETTGAEALEDREDDVDTKSHVKKVKKHVKKVHKHIKAAKTRLKKKSSKKTRKSSKKSSSKSKKSSAKKSKKSSKRKHASKKKSRKHKSKHAKFKDIPSEQYFYLFNGSVIKTPLQLISALEMMDDATFGHHANEHKNDFANWLDGVFGLHNAAQKMRGKSREEMIRVLKDEI